MMSAAMRSELQRRAKRLSSLNGRLEALSPLAVLERGYSIATTVEGTILTAADAVVHGDAMTVRLHRGRLHVRVEDSDLSDS